MIDLNNELHDEIEKESLNKQNRGGGHEMIKPCRSQEAPPHMRAEVWHEHWTQHTKIKKQKI